MGGGGSNEIPETEAEKTQAEIAMSRWNDYQRMFKPYEDKFFSEVDRINSAEQLNRAESLAVTPIAAEFAKRGRQVRDANYKGGVNPNSGKAVSDIAGLASQQMKASVNAASQATSSQQDRYVSGLQNIVLMGQGQAGTAMQGMTDIASMAQRNAANEAEKDFNRRQNVQQGAGALLGSSFRWGVDQAPKSNDTNGMG